MNKYLVPLLIFLGSLIYSWFWNCYRLPHCSGEVAVVPAVVAPVEDTTTVVVTAEEELLFDPLDVYFETGKSTISRNAELETWLATAKKYLEAHPDKKLSLTGHTDNQGTDESNQVLSVNRSEKVKSILTGEGFVEGQLESSGKGETEPVASNDTPEDMAKNRRVSIRLMN